MLTVSIPMTVNRFKMADGGVIYHYNPLLPSTMTSFKSCLEPSLWDGHYQPFACVIVSPLANECILVRDHLGVEPLYYCHYLGRTLMVAQTIPDLLQQLPSTPPLLESQVNMLFSEHKFYADETFYQGIYRVEPGHLMHFKSNGMVIKKAFWQLDPHGAMLDYNTDHDYADHFSMLMNEAILNSTAHQTNIAAEFSAGLDSSAVYCAAANNNLTPKLYMHIATPGTKSADIYDDQHEKAFVDHYQLTDIQRIGADHFDPLQVFNEYASWFAGPAPYLFPMFANPVHRAVQLGRHPILLSGFGGDQCISGQLSLNFILPELIHQGEYRQAWGELAKLSGLKKALTYVKHMSPGLYAQALKLKVMKRRIDNIRRQKTAYQSPSLHPYEHIYCPSVPDVEYSLLQGLYSHEVRMRIEYSSIVSKKMGFEYRYPLLYPKLLEFMLRVPTIQKRRDGHGRYLIRQYLSNCLHGDLFSTYRKQTGLGIVPSTFTLYQKNYEQGVYRDAFKHLPYQPMIQHNVQSIELRNAIKGFMLEAYRVTSQ